ncbi:hypothetical protein N7495_000056 [Penicillium taxi]|uniref:uncharacterized protein n=1 Tax=Penicillium taxi TaxID=168475 RepID=UPI002544EA66|nr:uncharacterized protein N7495_000056 [Penicillium taxi]KAJ5907374.1 hypothetical protein N7495_000056 [Penicillium taxi]
MLATSKNGVDAPPQPRRSIAAGCEGFRTDLWLHEHQLHFTSDPQEENDLQLQLDLLFTDLHAEDPPEHVQMIMTEASPT